MSDFDDLSEVPSIGQDTFARRVQIHLRGKEVLFRKIEAIVLTKSYRGTDCCMPPNCMHLTVPTELDGRIQKSMVPIGNHHYYWLP